MRNKSYGSSFWDELPTRKKNPYETPLYKKELDNQEIGLHRQKFTADFNKSTSSKMKRYLGQTSSSRRFDPYDRNYKTQNSTNHKNTTSPSSNLYKETYYPSKIKYLSDLAKLPSSTSRAEPWWRLDRANSKLIFKKNILTL